MQGSGVTCGDGPPGAAVGLGWVSLTRTDEGEALARLPGLGFSEALLQGGAACILDLPSNWQGPPLPRPSCPHRLSLLQQVLQKGATLEGRADEVPQVLGSVLVLVADGTTQSATIELHHARTPQAPDPWRQLQPGGRWAGGGREGTGVWVCMLTLWRGTRLPPGSLASAPGPMND